MSLQYLQAAPTQHATTTDNTILLLQPASKRSQLLPTSHYSLVLPLILLSSYYQLHTTINFISSILLPTTHLLLITTPYYLPSTYLLFSFFLSPLSTAAKNFLYSTTYPFTALPTALPTFFPITSLLYYPPPYLLLIITTYLPTTPKLSYPFTFFLFLTNLPLYLLSTYYLSLYLKLTYPYKNSTRTFVPVPIFLY